MCGTTHEANRRCGGVRHALIDSRLALTQEQTAMPQKTFNRCGDFEVVWAGVVPTKAIRTKRVSSRHRKPCVQKRMRISDKPGRRPAAISQLLVTSAGSYPASLASPAAVSLPFVFCSCPYLSCRLCRPLHDPFLMCMVVRVILMLSPPPAVEVCLGDSGSPRFFPHAYLSIHSGGGSISAAGSCPASFRPLPAKRLIARTVMS